MCITCFLFKAAALQVKLENKAAKVKNIVSKKRKSVYYFIKERGFVQKLTCSCRAVGCFSLIIMVNFEFILPIFSIPFVTCI